MDAAGVEVRGKFSRFAIVLAISALIVPILIYIIGRALTGPYEGTLGLLGLIGDIYGDALTGSPSAWFLLLSPVLAVLVWFGVALLRRMPLFYGAGSPPAE